MQTKPDGLYFNMSFEDYLAEPRLSSSDLTHLMEGPPAYWAQSWMNPDKPERAETDAMVLGSAYHCMRLEPEEFDLRYCREFSPEDMEEGTLLKDTEYKAWLKEHGLPQTKAGETVLERAARIRDEGGPDTWHASYAEWEYCDKGERIAIAPKYYDEIKRDRERLEQNPEIQALLSDGYAEVSIFWTDPRTGLELKCRPDYLSASRMVHLKTWDSKSRGKPGNRAIADSFMYDGYYRTGWFYLMGLEWLRTTEDRPKAFGVGGAEIKSCDLLDQIRERTAPLDDWFLFLRRSGIPDIRARRIKWFRIPEGVEAQKAGAKNAVKNFKAGPSGLAIKADLEVSRCLDAYLENVEIFGTDGAPWFPRDMIADFEDEDFSSYWLDRLDDPR